MEQELAEKMVIGIVAFIILFAIIKVKNGIDKKITDYKEKKNK